MANLAQLKMLETLNGFLLVDKPAGIAFSTVVKAVKRKFNLVKVGHGGSLDAMASGLLVLLINDANKFVGDVMGADRAFSGTMRLGVRTNTHDIHGARIGEGIQVDPLTVDFKGALPNFKGDVFQTESRFCSVRKEGTSDYEIADTGDHVQFLTHVYRFQVNPSDERVSFEVAGTKSLLVKTLVNDLGEALGCGACLETLRRLRVGKFSVEEAVPFDKILSTEMCDFASLVLPIGVALSR